MSNNTNTNTEVQAADTSAAAPCVPAVSQDALRTLAALLLLNLQVHSGPGLWLDIDDQPSDCRLARIDGLDWPLSLIISEFPGDHERSIRRHVDLHVAAAGAGPFALDPKRRLCVFRAADFSLPPRWEVEFHRHPVEWLGLVLVVLQRAVSSVLAEAREGAAAPRPNAQPQSPVGEQASGPVFQPEA
jgi:hypothetical protein